MYIIPIDGEGGIVRESDGGRIPEEPKNRDWRDYLEWLAKGNTPKEDDR